jgi:hypothetical protein
MWGVVETWRPGRKISVLDNSVSSARLMQYADPAQHSLYGVDVHEPVIAAVQQCIEAAGFEGSFRMAGMEKSIPGDLTSPSLIRRSRSIWNRRICQPLGCTTWGRFGPNSSALSHEYALAQALEAAQLVVALLPTSFVDRFVNVLDHRDAHVNAARRVVGIFDLPASAFREEGATVHTSIAVFGRYRMGRVVRQSHSDLTIPLPALDLNLDDRIFGEARLGHRRWMTRALPLRPVTSQKRVRIAHDGRRIVLGFECGFVEAMVLNRVLDCRIRPLDGQRLPQGMHYAGSGRLDLEAYLVQDDPMAALDGLLRLIRGAGGVPQLAPGFLKHFRKRVRRSARQATPLRHTVWTTGVNAAERSSAWPSKAMLRTRKVGQPRDQGRRDRGVCAAAGRPLCLPRRRQSVRANAGRADGAFCRQQIRADLETVHEGLSVKYPQQAWRCVAECRRWVSTAG